MKLRTMSRNDWLGAPEQKENFIGAIIIIFIIATISWMIFYINSNGGFTYMPSDDHVYKRSPSGVYYRIDDDDDGW